MIISHHITLYCIWITEHIDDKYTEHSGLSAVPIRRHTHVNLTVKTVFELLLYDHMLPITHIWIYVMTDMRPTRSLGYLPKKSGWTAK